MVGKTSIFTRYTQGTYSNIDLKNRTVEAYYSNKSIIIQKRNITLNIWDTAGEEKYRALAPLYYRNSDGAILIFDLTRKETFKLCEKWIEELRNIIQNPFSLVIIGNKCDLTDFQVSDLEVKALCEKYDAEYFTVSAKLDKNISASFSKISNLIYEDKIIKQEKKVRKKCLRLNTNKGNNKEDSGGCCG